MNKSILYIYFAMGLSLSGCIDNDGPNNNCIEATGVIVTETRTVDDFHSIELQGVGNILLTQGSPQQLSIVTHQNIMSLIQTQVVNENLYIDLENCIQGMIDQLDYVITIPDIERLEINGVGNLEGQNAFDLNKLEIDLNGVGEVTLNGTADTLEIVSSGVGNVMAFDLVSQFCEVTLLGVGNVEVTAEAELDVNISGSGNVSYKGNPTIDANISGSGSLINAN